MKLRTLPAIRNVLVLMILVLTAAQALAGARITSWDDLRPSGDIAFDDPFARLSPDQLWDLRSIVRIRWLIANRKSEPNGVSAKEEQRLVNRLVDQGVDVEWLLSQREKVTEARRQKFASAGSGVVGTVIRIPGYAIPLFPEQQAVTEFLLVPWVAPCSHYPPPASNQVIHATITPGMPPRGRLEAVWIEGALHRKPSEHTLFLLDGVSRIQADYALAGKFISDYSARESNVLAKGAMAAPDSVQSWYGNIQMQITILFTRAMTAIRDRQSSGPVWIGMLLAFAYGALHTIGPGHGKAVVISYFAGHGGSLGRGIRMGIQIAACHVLSAVAVVGLTSFIIRQATGHAPADFWLIRLISYGVIGGIGAFMLWRALREERPKQHHHERCTLEEHGGHHDCCARHSLSSHTHGPMGFLALAAGAVPCTGAILILLFGLSHDLMVPSVLMVMMMSFGMAISMSAIGILAILGRNYAERRFDKNSSMGDRFNRGLRIVAASLILLIGVSLFALTMGEQHVPGVIKASADPVIRSHPVAHGKVEKPFGKTDYFVLPLADH